MNRQQFKQDLAEAIHGNLKKPVYIASGFFNEQQNATLTTLENLLTAQGKYFISPRQEGVVDIKDPMRSDLMGLIFERNVESIQESDQCYFLLDTSMGPFDLGTVWEFGYAVGNFLQDKTKKISNLKLWTTSDEVKSMFEVTLNNLVEAFGKIEKIRDAKGQALFYKDNVVNIKQSKSITGYSFTESNLNAVLKLDEKQIELINNSETVLLCIDNRPWQVSVLAGLLYSLGIEFLTCSFKGFDTNIMIAKSSAGHINLQGIYDVAKNKNTQIL